MFSDAGIRVSLIGGNSGPAYTFYTDNFEVSFRKITTPPSEQNAAGAAIDDMLLLWTRDAERYLVAKREAELEADRDHQARFFAAFQRPVPDGAHAEPLVQDDYQEHCSLVYGEHGFRILYPSSGEPCPDTLAPVRVLADGDVVRCDESLVAPWLCDLVYTFGPGMVFRAFCHGTRRFDAILAKYNVPLAAVVIYKSRVQTLLSVCTLRVDGTTVTVYSDRFRVARRAKLTPWSRDLLARADAHAILLEIIDVL